MKKILLLIIFLNLSVFVSPVMAKVDPLEKPNNKFGVHILFPDEISEAAKLVNSNGGDWGYVTIPIQNTDKNLIKWQNFMNDAKKLHIIPVIRLATNPIGDYWVKPDLFDAVDFANFLNSLIWPAKNRYIILYNEPNRAQEWGGEVRPDEYAQFCKDAISIFKDRNEDFFMLNAGFDVSAPNNHVLMNWSDYLSLMNQAVPGIFGLFDGWSSHAYPNPGYSSLPYNTSSVGIRSYQYELNYLQNNFSIYGLKIFITETGWDRNRNSDNTIQQYYEEAFNNIWTDNYIVAITPFLLSAQTGDYERFSLMDNTKPTGIYKKIQSLTKIAGNPQRDEKSSISEKTTDDNSNWSAQKTNIWNKTTLNFVKKIYKWLNIK